MATTTTATTLDVDQKVLCRIGYDWVPGVIVSVKEHLHAANDLVLPLAGAPLHFIQRANNDDANEDEDEESVDEEDFPRLQIGDVVPYRVKLTTREGIVMPGTNIEPQRIASIAAEGKWFIQRLTGAKIILHASQGRMQREDDLWKTALTSWLSEDFESVKEEAMVEAQCLLKWCASLRFVQGATFLVDLMSIPLPPKLGHELWHFFISGDDEERHTERPRWQDDYEGILHDYRIMSEWLNEACGINDRHLAKHFADDRKSRHAEHVAAINGDVMMLCWLFRFKYDYCRFPNDRPKPRNHERIMRENLEPARSTGDEMSAFPRDDDGWTPLHHAAACFNANIIDLYRIECGTWFPVIDEFNAKTLDGQTALDLALNDPSTRESLLKLQQKLYQEILNEAVRDGRLPDGIADFAELENLVTQYRLDIAEATTMVEEHDVHNRDAMTVALESGNDVQVQFLARLLDLKDLKTWRNKDGKGMLHVAAGRPASCYFAEQDAQQKKAKLIFMEYHWNHDNAAFYNEAKTYVDKERHSHFAQAVEDYEAMCQETADTLRKVQLVRWLIQQGVTLPEYSFIVHYCDFPIAKLLLEYRMETDIIINEQFEDKAPLAMVGVKQFLYSDAPDACSTASDVAIHCVHRPDFDERSCLTDACRLLLLAWLDSNGYVDLVKTRTSSGDSILHVAVHNKETVIAVWLAREFPILAHMRSATTGQLPVHVALERVADQDDCVEKALCQFMIQYSGEGRGYMAWLKDERAWALEDSNGRTVKDYASSCCFDDARKEALESGYKKAYRQLLEMLLDEKNSVQSFASHAEKNNLTEYIVGQYPSEMRFIHSCISLHRWDVLQWYEQTFYGDYDNHPLYQGLGRHLSIARWETTKWLPRVFCAPSENFSVGDFLEVLGRRRKRQGATNLDGSWMVYGWNLFSNRAYTVKVENGVCCTEVPGLNAATLRECDDTENNSHGSIQVLLHANHRGEYWYSSYVSQSIERNVGMICLKRRAARKSDGYKFWADNGREIVLAKVDDATGDAGETFIWQRAHVVASSDQDLTVEFHEADPPIQETIHRDSSRINRTGRYKLNYLCGQSATLNFLGPKRDQASLVLMTGLELAQRYGHEDIIQWIDEGMSRATLESSLHAKDNEFLIQFFSDAPTQVLDRIVQEAAISASLHDLSDKGSLVVSHLQNELYVFGRCWMSSNSLPLHGTPGGYSYREHNRLGLFRCAARLGRIDRVEWLIGHGGFDPSSDVAISALYDAAYGNHVHVMEALISRGVDATRPHAFSADGVIAFAYTLLELAVERLSGDVVSFLLGHEHRPHHQDLLKKAVGHLTVLSTEASMKDRMAADRLSILRQLVSAGLALADSATEVLSDALHTLEFVLRNDKKPSSERISGFVPVTRELICWLCAQGCDLSSAVERNQKLRNGEVSILLADLVGLSKTIWPVADAVAHGEPFDEVERLVQQSGTSIHAVRDPLGRTLVQVAVLADQAQHLEWLVMTKGADMDEPGDAKDGLGILDLARQNGLQNIVDTITRLRERQLTTI